MCQVAGRRPHDELRPSRTPPSVLRRTQEIPSGEELAEEKKEDPG